MNTPLTFNPEKLPVTVDAVFRRLFDDEGPDALSLHLVNALLRLDPPLTNVRQLRPQQDGDQAQHRGAILDLVLGDEDGRIVDIEMQVHRHELFRERVLFYWSRLYANQLKAGDDYVDLRPVISIVILRFKLLPDLPGWHHAYTITHVETHQPLSRHFALHVVELPKFTIRSIDDLKTPAEKWLYFILYAHRISSEEIARLGEPFPRAEARLKHISEDDILQLVALSELRAELDRNTIARLERERREAEAERERKRLEAERKRLEAEAERERDFQARLEAEAERERDFQARLEAEAERERDFQAQLEAEAELRLREAELERTRLETEAERDAAAARAKAAEAAEAEAQSAVRNVVLSYLRTRFGEERHWEALIDAVPTTRTLEATFQRLLTASSADEAVAALTA